MALDNAQFISELSITDPPGTDPVAQGDDHIRTTKRATQQSFPLVDAAVNITAAQMNQMAIKNEANVFTQTNRFNATQEIQERLRLIRTASNTFPQITYADESDVSVWDVYMDSRVGNEFDYRIDRRVGGVLQDTPITISSSAGFVAFQGAASPRADAADAASVTAWILRDEVPANRWQLRRESSNDGGDLLIQRRDASGTFQDNPLRITAAEGQIRAHNFSMRSQPELASNDSGYGFNTETGALRWLLNLKSSNATNTLELQRYNSSGVFQATIMEWPQGINRTKIPHPAIMEVQNDNLYLQRSAPDSPTARVGLSFRDDTGAKMWELYVQNPSTGSPNLLHLVQRRTAAGAAAGTPIKLDWANGNIIMDQLPTTAPATSKTLWISSGFIAITP